ncbi:hypothetical protein [Janthinobacterium sp. MDB2-8]|uniref:hypothetical protein n=1 Tax=Janthinobacterium sp. MDB2-8 TaxID=1259338 RepID=UPI003F28CB29
MTALRVAGLSVQIERYIDDHFPGVVACVLTDADGKRHAFTEKVPVLSSSDLRADSSYPKPGYIGCVIEHEWLDAAGRKLVQVNTEQPWGITSVSGVTVFNVLDAQIIDR